jgi:hypothetical protein
VANGKNGGDSPQKLYRASDTRPRHDDQRLATLGIARYESRRLVLYSDIAPDEARLLPGLVDQLYAAFEEYFGPLPPNREGSDFQMTGYLMKSQAPFREAGLLPEDLPDFPHGRHRGQEFWLNDQTTPYYRRHLLFHEATHSSMTTIPSRPRELLWYMEGMAELFATHTTDAAGKAYFRVMPVDRQAFPGLGRIRLIEDAVKSAGLRELESVIDLRPDDFSRNDAYAWTWALCAFLDTHPRYRERFRQSGAAVTGTSAFDINRLFETDLSAIREEWLLFAAHLCHGYDTELSAIDFRAGRPLAGEADVRRISIEARRGWQSSGVLVAAGQTYEVSASGRFVIARRGPGEHEPALAPVKAPRASAGASSSNEAIPGSREAPAAIDPIEWVSEPQGVSIRYHAGRPMGMLVGTIQAERQAGRWSTTMLDEFEIGRGRKFSPKVSGTLYLRINDFWNELSDNSGQVEVEIREVQMK